MLELLDGYEMPAAAWEPEVPAASEQLHACLARPTLLHGPNRLVQVDVAAERKRQPGDTGALEPDLNLRTRKRAALALALRSIAAARVFARCGGCPRNSSRAGALFFGEIVRRTGLLPSRVENAIAELAANGWITSDSF